MWLLVNLEELSIFVPEFERYKGTRGPPFCAVCSMGWWGGWVSWEWGSLLTVTSFLWNKC